MRITNLINAEEREGQINNYVIKFERVNRAKTIQTKQGKVATKKTISKSTSRAQNNNL